MGWTYTYAKHWKGNKIDRKAECDERLTWSNETKSSKVLKSAMVGTIYYGAVETTYTDGKREVWCAVFLTRVDSDEFGYKDMEESMQPYYYDCPMSILKLLTPTDNEDSLKWRETCYEKHRLAKEKDLGKFPIGTRIQFVMPFNTTKHKEGETVELIKMKRGARSTYWVCKESFCYFNRNQMKAIQNMCDIKVINGEAR